MASERGGADWTRGEFSDKIECECGEGTEVAERGRLAAQDGMMGWGGSRLSRQALARWGPYRRKALDREQTLKHDALLTSGEDRERAADGGRGLGSVDFGRHRVGLSLDGFWAMGQRKIKRLVMNSAQAEPSGRCTLLE